MVALAPTRLRGLLPTPAHPAWSWRTHAVASVLRSAASNVAQCDPIALRRRLDRFARLAPPRLDVRIRMTRFAGFRAAWLTPRRVRSNNIVLYLHGGGYSICSIETHKVMLSEMAVATGARTLAVEYRKAPEHPFLLPVDDCTHAYRQLLEKGVRPDQIVLAGDSAGGALAFAVVQRLRIEERPRQLVALSPWVDLRLRGESIETNARFDYVTPGALSRFADIYLRGADPDHPEASPVEANFRGFPPMLIQVGGAEILRSAIERMARRATVAGVDVQLQVWDGMFHGWHGFTGLLPDAKRAYRAIGRYVNPSSRL